MQGDGTHPRMGRVYRESTLNSSQAMVSVGGGVLPGLSSTSSSIHGVSSGVVSLAGTGGGGGGGFVVAIVGLDGLQWEEVYLRFRAGAPSSIMSQSCSESLSSFSPHSEARSGARDEAKRARRP